MRIILSCDCLTRKAGKDRRTRRASCVQGFATISEQIIVRGDGFVARLSRIDFYDTQGFLVARCPMEDRALRADDFAAADIGETLLPLPRLAARPVTRDGKNSILETSHRHGIGT